MGKLFSLGMFVQKLHWKRDVIFAAQSHALEGSPSFFYSLLSENLEAIMNSLFSDINITWCSSRLVNNNPSWFWKERFGFSFNNSRVHCTPAQPNHHTILLFKLFCIKHFVVKKNQFQKSFVPARKDILVFVLLL